MGSKSSRPGGGGGGALRAGQNSTTEITSGGAVAERIFDVENGGLLNAYGQLIPKRGNHLKVGDTLSMRALSSDKQKNGWKLDNGDKINLTSSVKITDIEEKQSTIIIKGQIKVARRQGVTTRTVSKRFNKTDRFMLEKA